jgi:acyl transferase domain-containing protein
MSSTPIAIVGRACVLPGALSPDELWARILAGDDLTSGAPDGRWGLDPAVALTSDPSDAADRAWSDRGGYVTGFEAVWDPTGFAVPPERLAGLDPLCHWVLHAGRRALSEAKHVDRARVGAVLGNLSFPSDGMSRHAEATWRSTSPSWQGRLEHGDVDPRDRFMSGLPSALLAEALGLGGPALSLDAACASALYAIGIACARLADSDDDVVLAGAVNRADPLFLHVGFCALHALSKSGRSRPFHVDADGLVPAEGCVIVALKRLDDAVRDGDTIHGVIRGVGLSNDGRTGGFLAPNAEGQVRAMRAAWADAGLDPATVGLVECHATGTPVGDKVELASMADVFGQAADVPIGSIKSNLGHPITAAGGAGLLKVLGAIAAGVRPRRAVSTGRRQRSRPRSGWSPRPSRG